jgi:hypothetical protein
MQGTCTFFGSHEPDIHKSYNAMENSDRPRFSLLRIDPVQLLLLVRTTSTAEAMFVCGRRSLLRCCPSRDPSLPSYEFSK